MYLEHKFTLHPLIRRQYEAIPPKFGFGMLGMATYYRTYSRLKENGEQEHWIDTVIRVVEGVLSIRKDWYIKQGIHWDEQEWQNIGHRMVDGIFHMRFLPAGRMLWTLGSNVIPAKGGMAANNCEYSHVTHLSKHASEILDSLALGVGVGWSAMDWKDELRSPSKREKIYVVPDDREGWAESLRLLIESYEKGSQTIRFDYSMIRPAGAPIKTFGGTASGYEVLEKLHDRVRQYLEDFVGGRVGRTETAANVINAIGACIVAGNVRRSAQLNLGAIDDEDFLLLKDFTRYDKEGEVVHQGTRDHRADVGWMSNNSVAIRTTEDFSKITDIAEQVRVNGEPGIINFMNIGKYGRMGEEIPDTAIGTNPCAEATLEHGELCCLLELFPGRCKDMNEFYATCEIGTIFASTVSLMPTHRESTNLVIARNRRIGVSVSGVADWFDTVPTAKLIEALRKGYRVVERTNAWYNYKAGVPKSIRTTVVKPSGSVSLLAGASPGMHYPIYNRYIRRMRVGVNTPIVPLLIEAGVPYEEDRASDNTLIFEFPIETTARRGQRDISMWQKGAMLMMLQDHWADQMVSNTITFDKKTEGGQVEDFLSMIIPKVKSLSLMPESEEGAYDQAPYEHITKVEYDRRAKQVRDIDWSAFGGSDGVDSKFCNNDGCEI